MQNVMSVYFLQVEINRVAENQSVREFKSAKPASVSVPIDRTSSKIGVVCRRGSGNEKTAT